MKHLNMRIVSLKSHWKPLSFDFSRIICRVRNDSIRAGITEQGLWSHVPGADLCAKEGRVCIHAVKQCSGASAWLKHSWWGAAKPEDGVSPTHPHCLPRRGLLPVLCRAQVWLFPAFHHHVSSAAKPVGPFRQVLVPCWRATKKFKHGTSAMSRPSGHLRNSSLSAW